MITPNFALKLENIHFPGIKESIKVKFIEALVRKLRKYSEEKMAFETHILVWYVVRNLNHTIFLLSK